MDQETRWLLRYNEVKSFIETNKRNPSKYNPEERLMCHFMKRGWKLICPFRKGPKGNVLFSLTPRK